MLPRVAAARITRALVALVASVASVALALALASPLGACAPGRFGDADPRARIRRNSPPFATICVVRAQRWSPEVTFSVHDGGLVVGALGPETSVCWWAVRGRHAVVVVTGTPGPAAARATVDVGAGELRVLHFDTLAGEIVDADRRPELSDEEDDDADPP